MRVKEKIERFPVKHLTRLRCQGRSQRMITAIVMVAFRMTGKNLQKKVNYLILYLIWTVRKLRKSQKTIIFVKLLKVPMTTI